MKIYCLVVYVLVLITTIPGFIANALNANSNVLSGIAALQLVMSLLVWLSLPITMLMMIQFVALRDWRRVGWAVSTLPAPLLSFLVIGLSNKLGMQGIMGV